MYDLTEKRYTTKSGNLLVVPEKGSFSYYMSKRGKVLRVCSLENEEEYAKTWGVKPQICEYVDKINSVENTLFARLFGFSRALAAAKCDECCDGNYEIDAQQNGLDNYLEYELCSYYEDWVTKVVAINKRSVEITINLGLGYEIAKRGYLY